MVPDGGVEVPGGVVVVDMLRGGGKLHYWLRMVNASLASYTASTNAVSRDIVVLDPRRRRVLYREGPYDGTTVTSAFRQVVDEIRSVGLERFVQERMEEQARSSPDEWCARS
jgi:hypothetical protein